MRSLDTDRDCVILNVPSHFERAAARIPRRRESSAFGPPMLPFAHAAVKDAARRFAVPPFGRHP